MISQSISLKHAGFSGYIFAYKGAADQSFDAHMPVCMINKLHFSG
jgi:hypothetical protein